MPIGGLLRRVGPELAGRVDGALDRRFELGDRKGAPRELITPYP